MGICLALFDPRPCCQLEPSRGLPMEPILPQVGLHRPQDALVRSTSSVKISPVWGTPTSTATFLQNLSLPHSHWFQAPPLH